MVEVLAAVVILAIVVTAVVTSISFSQRTILSESTQSDAAAQAQNIADTLMEKLHGADKINPDDLEMDGVQQVDSGDFPNPEYDRQFTVTAVDDEQGDVTVSGYRIKTAVYFTDSTGRKCVQMTAFAAKDGDAG